MPFSVHVQKCFKLLIFDLFAVEVHVVEVTHGHQCGQDHDHLAVEEAAVEVSVGVAATG